MSLTKMKMVFPNFQPKDCRAIDMRDALEEIKYSKNCLALLETDSNKLQYLFTGFNEELLSTLVVLLRTHIQLYEFLKFAIIISDELKKSHTKGIMLYSDVLTYLSQKFPETLKGKSFDL